VTVIIVPTWAIWAFIGFAVVNIVQNCWLIVLRKRAERQADTQEKP
jgi:hypothetical protein